MELSILRTKSFIGLLFFFIMATSSLFSTPDEEPLHSIRNPRLNNKWISDYGILSKEAFSELNSCLDHLEKSKGVEFAVIIENNLPVTDLKQFAHRLFNYWGIGKKDDNNGLLFIMAIRQRKWAFETGYGLEATLPDSLLGRVARNRMVPEFKNENYEKGIVSGLSEIISILANEDKENLKAPSPPGISAPLTRDKTGYSLILFRVLSLIFFSTFVSMGVLLKNKPNGMEKADNWHFIYVGLLISGANLISQLANHSVIKIFSGHHFFVPFAELCLSLIVFLSTWQGWRSINSTPKSIRLMYFILIMYFSFILFSSNFLFREKSILVFTIFWILLIPLYYYLRARIRYGIRICPECKKEFKLLNEKDEDAWLSLGQRVEEDLKSREYDVWFCQDCESVKIENYLKAGKFDTCPKCDFLTYCFVEDKVISRASYSSSGKGVKIYKCQKCKYVKNDYYTIPKLQRSSSRSSWSSGSYSSGGSSFGGGGGGSFGGGSSGGGGASGGW